MQVIIIPCFSSKNTILELDPAISCMSMYPQACIVDTRFRPYLFPFLTIRNKDMLELMLAGIFIWFLCVYMQGMRELIKVVQMTFLLSFPYF